jgi:hypothetical protein
LPALHCMGQLHCLYDHPVTQCVSRSNCLPCDLSPAAVYHLRGVWLG